jgi:hypothetical protein
MKMKRQHGVRLFLVVISCAALSASARLGETEAESERRYGPPMKTLEDPLHYTPLIEGAVNHTYKFQGWYIRTAFVEGRAARIVYMKILAKDVKPPIQDDELQAILAGEAGGGRWQVKSNATLDPGQLLVVAVTNPSTWINSNGNSAHIAAPRYMITLESPAAAAFIQARAAAKEQQRKANVPKF